MNDHLSPEERSWRQTLRSHEFPLRDSDWQAMEQLIGQADRPGGPVPGTSPDLPGPRWPFPFLTGVLISIVILAMQGLSSQGPPAPAPPHREMPARQALIGPLADQDRLPDSQPDLAEASPATTRIATSIGKPDARTPKTPSLPAGVGKTDPSWPVQPSARSVPIAMTDEPEVQPGLPTATPVRPRSFDELTEAEYTPGLMAFSRLIAGAPAGVTGSAPELAATRMDPRPFSTDWSFGILGGPRLAFPVWPFRSTAMGWHAGLFVQADLSPRWAIRTELAVKTLDNELQRESSDRIFDEFGASIQVDQTVYTNGLIFLDLPLLIVHRRGRHEWFAGPRISRVMLDDGGANIASSGQAFKEVDYLDIRDGIRTTDLGLVLGYGYRLHRSWAVDLRYNQGLFDLTHDHFFSNTRTLLHSDLQFSLRYAF